MILISHRGNITGPKEENENNPAQLTKLVSEGYDVEIDVWALEDGSIFLGHDKPTYKVNLEYIKNEHFWCHAKNLQALNFMLENNVHCFWHQTDDYTITSKGFVWTFPKKPAGEKSVIVCHSLEETIEKSKLKIAGICSDYVGEIR